jgi:hypothetical protein
MKSPVQTMFVIETCAGDDIKARTLQQSKVRSHAANISHARRRTKKATPEQMVANLRPSATEGVYYQSVVDDTAPRSRPQLPLRSWSHPGRLITTAKFTQPAKSLGSGGLDPFLALSAEITINDRRKIQRCKSH